MWDWLLASLDTSCIHDVSWNLSWHARLLVVAWGFLIPIGILSARFFKVLPGQNWPQHLDNRLWWQVHRVCQYSASVLMVIGLWLIMTATSVIAVPGPHQFLGWTLLTMALVQVLGGILRGTKGGPTEPAKDGTPRGDHFDMTQRRVVFEYLHKALGYVALILSIATILAGLWQANAANWMWLTLGN